ncbi:MAG: nuclear transport factor 2 family protein [Pseudobdellovibrio sp.]
MPVMKSNKEIATFFLNLAANGEVEEAYEKFVAPDFKHHNQYFSGDRESLKQGMIESAQKKPNKKFEIKMVIQDEDVVSAFSHLKFHADDIGMAVVHILKFKNEKIIEMWDLGQPIPKDSPNKNGMF